MATGYPILYSILLTAVCNTIWLGDYFITVRGMQTPLLSNDLGGQQQPHHAAEVSFSQLAMPDTALNSYRQKPTDSMRQRVYQIARGELGIREASGNNDGQRVEQYLRYTNLGKGYEWCAAFVSWCYGQAGVPVPRTPWSPALFPHERSIRFAQLQRADLFGIYSAVANRINHVGMVADIKGHFVRTIEGNSADQVQSRYRNRRTIYCYAKWL